MPIPRLILRVIIWIVFINLFAIFAWNRVNVTIDTAYPWIDPHHLHASSWSVLELPERWDSEWYLDIAKNGYLFKPADQLQNTVFYPVYPFLIRVVGVAFGGHYALAGWLISLVSLVGACVVLQALVKSFHPKLPAEEVIDFLILFPTAIFFQAIYTESLFLLLSVSAIYFARKKIWVWASLIAAAAALTRITGALLLLPLLMEYVASRRNKALFDREALWLIAVPTAAISFFLFHWLHTGDWLFFFHVESTWGRSFAFNPEHFRFATANAIVNFACDAGFLAVAVASLTYVYRKIRPSYAVYGFASILVPLSSGTMMSIGRYVLVLFPMYLAFASAKPEYRRMMMGVSAMFLALYTLLFAHSYWAG